MHRRTGSLRNPATEDCAQLRLQVREGVKKPDICVYSLTVSFSLCFFIFEYDYMCHFHTTSRIPKSPLANGKGRITPPNRMNFQKSSKEGGGSFSIQKFMLQILDLSIGLFSDVFRKKLQYNFPKMGGQMPVFQKFIRFGSVTLP